MLEKIIEIIQEQLDCSGKQLTAQTTFKGDLAVDSLDLFELVMALEEEFDTEIPSEDLEKIATINDIAEYLKEKGVEA